MTAFDQLGLAENLLRAVRAEGYHTATPIQAEAIPVLLTGRDLMGCAQTGTGKTAAFALPTLHRLERTDASKPSDRERCARSRTIYATAQNGGRRAIRDAIPPPAKPRHRARPIRSLILAPTRELAVQIGQSFKTYGQFTGLRYTSSTAASAKARRCGLCRMASTCLVATPGRLLDLMEQGYINLRNVEILILDEADQMLDMGFIVPLRKIVASVPKTRQTLMFSATMPPEIRKLASEWLSDPLNIQVAPGCFADRVGRAIGLLCRAAAQAAVAHALLAEHGLHASDRLRPHEARG